MNNDAASLDNLRDIAELPPVSWWPPAPGWWMLLAVFIASLVVVAWRRWRTWRANAYRRAALEELERADDATTVAEILKRTALVASPRTDVASMSGQAWCRWLAGRSDRELSDTVAMMLTRGIYGNHSSSSLSALKEFAAAWIVHHPDQRVCSADHGRVLGKGTEC